MLRTARVFSQTKDLYQAAAHHCSEVVGQAVEDRGIAYVALSGGETPKGLFEYLATCEFQKKISWGQIYFYWRKVIRFDLGAVVNSNLKQLIEVIS